MSLTFTRVGNCWKPAEAATSPRKSSEFLAQQSPHPCWGLKGRNTQVEAVPCLAGMEIQFQVSSRTTLTWKLNKELNLNLKGCHNVPEFLVSNTQLVLEGLLPNGCSSNEKNIENYGFCLKNSRVASRWGKQPYIVYHWEVTHTVAWPCVVIYTGHSTHCNSKTPLRRLFEPSTLTI